jgi:hypothetical protein
MVNACRDRAGLSTDRGDRAIAAQTRDRGCPSRPTTTLTGKRHSCRPPPPACSPSCSHETTTCADAAWRAWCQKDLTRGHSAGCCAPWSRPGSCPKSRVQLQDGGLPPTTRCGGGDELTGRCKKVFAPGRLGSAPRKTASQSSSNRLDELLRVNRVRHQLAFPLGVLDPCCATCGAAAASLRA